MKIIFKENYQKEISEIKDFLYWILFIWTVAIFVMGWTEFLFKKFTISNSMVFSYLVLLAAYIAGKEAGRWNGISMTARPGQIFVYIWWLNLLTMFILSFFFPVLEVSYQIKNLTYDVTGGLIASELSKIFVLRSAKKS